MKSGLPKFRVTLFENEKDLASNFQGGWIWEGHAFDAEDAAETAGDVYASTCPAEELQGGLLLIVQDEEGRYYSVDLDVDWEPNTSVRKLAELSTN